MHNDAIVIMYIIQQDLIKLYTAYNDILINLLDKFFESKKSQCKETIDTYRKFLTRQEGVQKFLSLAEVCTYSEYWCVSRNKWFCKSGPLTTV